MKDFWDTVNNRNKVSANVLDDDAISIEQAEQGFVVVVRVPRADREYKPVYVDRNPIGGTYRRSGEGDYKCSEEEYRAMVRDSGTGSVSLDHMPLKRYDLDDLDSDTVAAYRNSLSAVRPGHPWLALGADEFLIRLGAVAKDENGALRPSRAGLLMFGREWRITQEFPYYFLDYREVSDDARRWSHRIVSGDGEWSGNLYDFWMRVWPRLARVATRPFGLDSDMRRVDDTPLHIALREALANTIIHADYYMRGNTVVVQERDTVTFANPGGLRMPPDVVMAGGLSDSRNPTLLKMFALISVAERAGSGFDAMRVGCNWAHIPRPELVESFDPDRTSLTFHLDSTVDSENMRQDVLGGVSVMVSAPVADFDHSVSESGKDDDPALFHSDDDTLREGWNDVVSDVVTGETDRDRVLAYLRQSSSVTRAQVEWLIGSSASKAKYVLGQLVDEGVVQRRGRGRGTQYVLR